MNLNATLIGQVIWFALFIFFVMKFVWPYFQRIVAERQKTIADGLAAGEKGQKDLGAAKSKADDIIREARSRATQIENQAQHRANELIDEAKKNAIGEGERLLAAAQQQIQQESTRAREALRKDVATLAVTGAAQLLEREIDPKAHAALLDKLAAQL